MILPKLLQKFRSQGAAFTHDLIMIPCAWVVAYWFRLNLGHFSLSYFDQVLPALVVIIPVQLLTFVMLGLYRGVWRFASLPDIVRILKAVAIGTAISMTFLFFVTRMEGIPRSVPILYAMLLVLFLSGPRLLYRWIKDHHVYLHPSRQRVLIIGAGRAGEMLVRDMLRGGGSQYKPVAFIDDRARRQGQDVHGVPVVGGSDEIPNAAKRMSIELILLAIPSSSAAQMRRVVDLCEQAGVPFRTVPNLRALVSGQVSINELRKVSIEDILGRDPVSLDWDAISAGLAKRTILVTGGGGSIGSELCRQIARLEPERLVLLENSEYNLYSIERELQQQFSGLALEACLGDVGDVATVDWVFSTYRPEVVFHAAAYKHVPMLEYQVREAVRNNVLGTRNIALAADCFGCSEFVLISTDKAVNPANVMGTSKRMSEIFCQNLDARSKTRFITVRFGNVLGSAGSVVPLFREQIVSGGPVTVTHREMERYFMTIPEASQLIMQASVIGQGGEIFVLDMGEPIKISYLAEQMIKLSGKEPGSDIEISYTGLRPGEKLYEELFHDQEALEATNNKKILLAKHRKVDWDSLTAAMQDMEQACGTYDDACLVQRLREFVPENCIGQPELSIDGKTRKTTV
ncbi:polysaccharide biosynthesis protein [Pseudomonadota bacterium]